MTAEPQTIRRPGRVDLDADELREITRYQRPAAQARFLEAMKVPYQRRKDGSLLVGRAAMERALLGAAGPAAAHDEPEDGIVWKVK